MLWRISADLSGKDGTMPSHVHHYDAHGRHVDTWPEIEPSLLEDGRAPVPSFPLDVLPRPWRDWIADTAHGAGAPDDYVAQAVLAAVAGLGGAGVTARVTASWSEPLVLWLAPVGAPSSGKTPALEAIRRPLANVETMLGRGGGAPTVVGDGSLDGLAKAVSARRQGVLLWRDEPTQRLGGLGWENKGDKAHGRFLDAWSAADKFPVSIIGSLHPEQLAEALDSAGDGMAARFLFAWPSPPLYRPLAGGKEPRADEAVTMLHRIAGAVGTPDRPLVLAFEEAALKYFDRFLAGLQGEIRRAEGFYAGWLGKGRGTVARLAGILALLDWAGRGASERPPRAIGRDHVQAADRLWDAYFKPHARAVFDRAVPSARESQIRRVIHWLEARRATEVSREDIRRDALCQSVDANGADQVIYRLEGAGVLRPLSRELSGPGRPARRWQVNPALALGGVAEIAGIAETPLKPSPA
jgi:hypothetical protein